MPRNPRDKIDRQFKVAAMRLSGLTDQQEIARRLGVHQSTISRDFAELDDQFRAHAVQDITTAKGIDVARLEALIAAIWEPAMSGKWLAIDRVLKCLERRAALLGLDAPQKREISGSLELRSYAERVAGELGLDAGEVLSQAERIIAEAATS